MKTVGNSRKTRFIGFGANQIAAYMVGAAYNLLRIGRLLAAPRVIDVPQVWQPTPASPAGSGALR